MLEGYSEDASQEVHAGSGAHGSQQSHQMVSVPSTFCSEKILSTLKWRHIYQKLKKLTNAWKEVNIRIP